MDNAILNDCDVEYIKGKYENAFEKNGFSPKAVLWTKRKTTNKV